MAHLLLAGRITSSWDDPTLEHHSCHGDLKLIRCKNDPSPQDANRSWLLLELKPSGLWGPQADCSGGDFAVAKYQNSDTDSGLNNPDAGGFVKALCKDA